MASDPTLLPLQLRRNNEDMQQMLKSLNNWEDEIKKRDELLKKQKPILKKKVPPIRGKTTQQSTKIKVKKDDSSQDKPKRIKSFDYNAWSKFDVESACIEVEESDEEEVEEEEEDEEEEEHRREMANLEKERGNQLFKEGKYEAAIEHYTKGVELDSLSAILPANRAMALLKLKRYAAAEKDCDLALSLDDAYVKAWLRRATARAELNKIQPAMNDLRQVLVLEPNNKHAKNELEKLKQSVTVTQSQVLDKRHVPRMKRPPHLRSKEPLVRIQIEEVGGDTHSKPEEIQSKVTEIPVESSQETILQDVTYDVPTNSLQFQCDWKSLQHSEYTKLVEYFKAIPPSQYPLVLRQSLESQVFTEIIDILDKEYIQYEQGLSCYEELNWLTKVQRFSVAVMFLSKKDKQKLKTIFEQLQTLLCSNDHPTDVLKLAKQYSISF